MVLREELNTECGTCGCVRHRGVPRRTLGIPGLADTRCVRPARGCPPTLNTLVLNLSKDSGYSSDESCEFTVASVIAPTYTFTRRTTDTPTGGAHAFEREIAAPQGRRADLCLSPDAAGRRSSELARIVCSATGAQAAGSRPDARGRRLLPSRSETISAQVKDAFRSASSSVRCCSTVLQ